MQFSCITAIVQPLWKSLIVSQNIKKIPINFRWYPCNTIYRWCITELYTWNLYNFINQFTPINSIKILTKKITSKNQWWGRWQMSEWKSHWPPPGANLELQLNMEKLPRTNNWTIAREKLYNFRQTRISFSTTCLVRSVVETREGKPGAHR